jgi:CubicO group peptidase (beta-lactamase class C family)
MRRDLWRRLAVIGFAVIILGFGERADAQELASRIDAYLKPFVEGNNFIGVVYIAQGDRVLFQKGYGLADYEWSSPNTPETRFHIASISKAFTAAAVLLLEERGKLATSAPVSTYVSDYPGGEDQEQQLPWLQSRSHLDSNADLNEKSSIRSMNSGVNQK